MYVVLIVCGCLGYIYATVVDVLMWLCCYLCGVYGVAVSCYGSIKAVRLYVVVAISVWLMWLRMNGYSSIVYSCIGVYGYALLYGYYAGV